MEYGTMEKIGSGQTTDKDVLLFDGTSFEPSGRVELYAVTQIIKTMTDASTTTAYTGIGFKPKFMFCLAVEKGTPVASWGFTNTDTYVSYPAFGGVQFTDSTSAGSFDNTAPELIYVEDGAPTNNYAGRVTVLSADGFSIQWTRNGTPSGNLYCKIICFR